MSEYLHSSGIAFPASDDWALIMVPYYVYFLNIFRIWFYIFRCIIFIRHTAFLDVYPCFAQFSMGSESLPPPFIPRPSGWEILNVLLMPLNGPHVCAEPGTLIIDALVIERRQKQNESHVCVRSVRSLSLSVIPSYSAMATGIWGRERQTLAFLKSSPSSRVLLL